MSTRTITWTPKHFDGSALTGKVDISQGPVMVGGGTTTYVKDVKTYTLVNGTLTAALVPTNLPEHGGLDWSYILRPILYDTNGNMVPGSVPFTIKVPTGTGTLNIADQVPNDVVESVNLKYVEGPAGASPRQIIRVGSVSVGDTPNVSAQSSGNTHTLNFTFPRGATVSTVSTGILKITTN